MSSSHLVGPRSGLRAAPDSARRWTWGLSAGRIVVAAVTGTALGFAASASNAWPSVLTYVLNAGWVWAGVMVAGGLAARRALGGMVTGLIAVAVASAAYFLGDSWWAGASRGAVEQESFGYFVPEQLFWVLLAIVLAPFLGAVGALQRRRDLPGLLATLVVPVGISAEMLLPIRWGDPESRGEVALQWLVWVAALSVALWAVLRFLRWRRRPERPAARGTAAPRGQVVLVSVLGCLSLVVGGGYVVAGIGVFDPARRGAGLTAAQGEADVIARIRVVDGASDEAAATVTMSQGQLLDAEDPPPREFALDATAGVDWQQGQEYVVFLEGSEESEDSGPTRAYRLVDGPHAVVPIGSDDTVPDGLPGWVETSLGVSSP